MSHIALLSHLDRNLTKFRAPIFKALRKKGYQVSALVPPGGDTATFAKLGASFHPYTMNRKDVGLGENLKVIIRIRNILRKIRPDLIHTFTVKPNILGTISSLGTGALIVNSVTGLGSIFIKTPNETYFKKLLRWCTVAAYRFCFHFSNAVIFQNPDDMKFFETHRIVKSSKTHLIPGSGIDTNAFYPCSEGEKNSLKQSLLSLSPEVRVIVFVGRLLKDKGVQEFGEASAILGDLKDRLHFIAIGSSDSGNPSSLDIEKLAKDFTNVTWLGHKDNIQEYLWLSDVFCLPSYREGLPMSGLEAMASGLPIVTTDVPGCREIVIGDENGVLTIAGNSESLASGIRKIIDLEESDFKKMKSASRAHAENRYSSEIIADMHMKLYEELLGKRSK